MKISLGLLALLSLFSFYIGCNRNVQHEEEIQREESMRGDDMREDDSYKRSVPTEDDELHMEREDLDIGPHESTVTD